MKIVCYIIVIFIKWYSFYLQKNKLLVISAKITVVFVYINVSCDDMLSIINLHRQIHALLSIQLLDYINNEKFCLRYHNYISINKDKTLLHEN